MEGSAISRSLQGLSISNKKDPDMDGNSMVHPTSQSIIKNAQQPKGLGRDSFIDTDPKGDIEIKGGQEVCG